MNCDLSMLDIGLFTIIIIRQDTILIVKWHSTNTSFIQRFFTRSNDAVIFALLLLVGWDWHKHPSVIDAIKILFIVVKLTNKSSHFKFNEMKRIDAVH